MRIQFGENLSFPEWDLNEDLLSEGVEAKRPMEIASLSKNMEESCTSKLAGGSSLKKKKTLKQDISEMLRIIANRKKYAKESKVKAISHELSKNIINQEYFMSNHKSEKVDYITMKEIPCANND